VVVCFVDIGGFNDHHCWEVAVYFVDIVGINDHHCLEVENKQPPLNSDSH
jgi:hypothetical protein